jgi:hypothetical protein
VGTEVREDLLFGVAVSGVVPHHEDVDRALGREPPRELAVVGGEPHGANLPLLPKSKKLLADAVGELLGLHDPEEEEDVEAVGPKLPEPLLQGATQVRMSQDQVVSPGGDHQILAPAPGEVPENGCHLGVEAVAEEEVHPLVQGPVHGLLPGAVAGREPEPEDPASRPAQDAVGEARIVHDASLRPAPRIPRLPAPLSLVRGVGRC